MRSNPYIRTGYRAYLDNYTCLKSLCVLSNEWVNVWSHLGGAFLAMVALYYDNMVVFPRLEASHPERGQADRLAMSFFVLCTVVRHHVLHDVKRVHSNDPIQNDSGVRLKTFVN